MNSLLYYYNNVQKMASYRQAKRMQRGVITTQGGFSTKDPALLQVPCTIQCAFIPRIALESFQTIFTTTTGSVSPRIDITSKSKLQIFVAITSTVIPVDLDKLYNIVFVIDTNIQSFYVNGELLKNAEFSISSLAEYSIGSKNNKSDRFQGDYLLHRHFNYTMSADEVKALDNNGDPIGYVVPKAKRDGLLAEYLPQNLMYSKDDKTIATSWLDSAKQMPLSDEYMEPLFQSIGGYNMAANGAPEILYNE